MNCTGCASAVLVATGSSSWGVSAPPRSHRNSVSRSCQCHASVVLDSLLSHPQARLDRCCRQRGSDRLLLRSSDVSEVRLVLTSHVLHCGVRDLVLHCLAIKLLLWTLVAAAASGCFCRVLIVALILACSHPLWVRSFEFFSTVVPVKAAGTSRCFHLTVAPCTTFSWRSMSCVVANCSLTDVPPRAARGFAFTSKSCLGPLAEGLSVDTIVAVFCFGLRGRLPPALSLFPQLLLWWPCASWSVGTSRLRHACTDRPVSMSGGALRL